MSLGNIVRKKVNRRGVKQRIWELCGPAHRLMSCGDEEKESQEACKVQQKGAVMQYGVIKGPKVRSNVVDEIWSTGSRDGRSLSVPMLVLLLTMAAVYRRMG